MPEVKVEVLTWSALCWFEGFGTWVGVGGLRDGNTFRDFGEEISPQYTALPCPHSSRKSYPILSHISSPLPPRQPHPCAPPPPSPKTTPPKETQNRLFIRLVYILSRMFSANHVLHLLPLYLPPLKVFLVYENGRDTSGIRGGFVLQGKETVVGARETVRTGGARL